MADSWALSARMPVREHPAIEAWRVLRPARIEVDGVETLEERKKSKVYRMRGVGPGGATIIAKQCWRNTASIERTIYETVLPQLPLPRLQYYGCVQSDEDRCWLFVEDAGVERYSPHTEEHRRLAARWLGTMHTTAAQVAIASGLPDRGLRHYVTRLQSASALVRRLLANIPLEGDDRNVLQSIVARCEQLTARWSAVEQMCYSVPRTVVHGDFRGKNMRVRTDHSGTVLLPFDWETAGWGLPTIDLAWLVYDGALASASRAMDIYRSTISQLWPELAVHDIGVLAHLGTVFRLLDAVNWACDGLVHERVDEATEKSLGQLRFYQQSMITAMENLNL
jgi:hypothetical protein